MSEDEKPNKNRSTIYQRDVDVTDPKKKELFEIYERNKMHLFLEKDQVSFTVLCFYKPNMEKFELGLKNSKSTPNYLI